MHTDFFVDILYSYGRNFTRQIPSDYADNAMPEYGDTSSEYEDDNNFMVECYSIDSDDEGQEGG